MDMPKTLCHVTNRYALPLIEKDGIIELEGYAIMQNKVATDQGLIDIPKDVNYEKLKTHLINQYGTIGRYVWLTEETQCLSVYDQTPKLQRVLMINTQKIQGLQRWSDVRKTFFASPKARKLISELEAVATQVGDDYTRWWVTKHRIHL